MCAQYLIWREKRNNAVRLLSHFLHFPFINCQTKMFTSASTLIKYNNRRRGLAIYKKVLILGGERRRFNARHPLSSFLRRSSEAISAQRPLTVVVWISIHEPFFCYALPLKPFIFIESKWQLCNSGS